MPDDERVVETRPARRAYGALAAGAVATAVGATVWAYFEYAGAARTAWLALALGVICFSVSWTVLLAFRASFDFETVQAPRPLPPREENPVDSGGRSRRGLVGLLGGAALSLVGVVLLPLRSLGSRPRSVLYATAWRRGVRLLTLGGVPLRARDLPPGSFTPVVPDGAAGDGNSAAVLVRLRDSGACRAYSRICTHAGCAVCVFQASRSRLVCPCHHSTFDAADGGRILSGPASQALPELPLAADSEGYLVADGDFDRPVGPLPG